MILAGILNVLKIIGIILLVILAAILVLLLLVLFAPIRYRIDGSVPRTNLDDGFDPQIINASVKFRWLLFVLTGGIEFPENKAFTLKVFGIKILPGKDKSEKEKSGKEKPKKKKSKKGEDAEAKEDEKTEPEKAEDAQTPKGEVAAEVSTPQAGLSEDLAKEDTEKEPVSFLDVLWKIFDTIDKILKTPLDVLSKIQCTISGVCGKIDMIKITLESEIFKRAFALVKGKLLKIIRMILPDKCKIDLLLGTGDPALTAELMGAYGAMYPVLYKKVKIQPEFEEKAVMADVHMKGHITLFTIVYSAAVCYFNKDVKKVIRRFKKIMNS